eukprot:TRINITY_DN65324_c0_g1_i1.p1 TRINITY_DN65324_c0_g1~~TRINITY_DN65324_c0_g1_i1.p1  ORF type:complete len:542 (+),score=210.56 TRINITY_DN65324_c0_g1_i1:97-1626(+)
MALSMRGPVAAAFAQRAGRRAAAAALAQRRWASLAPFPSLQISRSGVKANGTFAEAQADYLQPDTGAVSRLGELLKKHNAGLVAHFYMDPELQGVIGAVDWPHVFVSDSLAMADAAVAMAEKGCKNIVVMGVDFMSENVRAVLDYKGFTDVTVLRLCDKEIGCTLAESADSKAYAAWLQKAAKTPNSLHVVYINTSLITKARSHAVVPTITCTSSNVVRTVLQATAQIPDLTVWYGPDTHMGKNLREIFTRLAERPDEEIQQLHPAHTQQSIRALLKRFEVFPQGICIVHHMFGSGVVKRLREEYPDALHTAHLEVPGEMFGLAAEAREMGRGAVGSTSDILSFIKRSVDLATERDGPQKVRVTLGTEAGMVTPIVKQVQQKLADCGRDDVELELIFPVAAEAVAPSEDPSLGIVPGVAAGEGCSSAGGCATCKFMKMNSLDGLLDLLEGLDKKPAGALKAYHPRIYAELIDGRSAAEIGGETILHMRAFQHTQKLPDNLVSHVTAATA